MGVQTIVHGRISLQGDYAKSRNFILSLKDDEYYPVLRTEMFSLRAVERPFYYNDSIVGFAADYKGLEYDWTAFILKFEHILRNIEFATAKIQMETEYVGTYNFFWRSKQHIISTFKEEDQLIETKEVVLWLWI